MLFKRGELKLLWPFYTYYLVGGFITLLVAYMTVYFLNLGFTYFQMMSFMAAFSLSTMLFEIPTGAVADGVGRKASVITGFITAGIAGLLIAHVTAYWPIFLGMVLIGIGIAFMSGAEEAWVIDNLRFRRRKDLQKVFLVRSQAIAAVSMLVVPLCGAVVTARFGIGSVWTIFGAASLLCAFFLLVAAPEHYKPRGIRTSALRASYHSSRKALSYVRKDDILLPLFLGSVFFALMSGADDGWQPFLVMQGLPQASLGYLFAFLGGAGLLIPFLVPVLERLGQRGALRALAGIVLVLTLAVFLLPAQALVASILLFFLLRLSHLINYPIAADIMHNAVPSNIRATVGSVRSMVVNLAFVILLLPAGYAMDLYGPQKVIAACAIFGIGAWVLFGKMPSGKSAQTRI